MQVEALAKPFLVCEVGFGITTSFQFDNWTSLDPLIEITCKNGPRFSSLPFYPVMADALRNVLWWISSSRSKNPIIRLLLHCLPNPTLIFDLEEYIYGKQV